MSNKTTVLNLGLSLTEQGVSTGANTVSKGFIFSVVIFRKIGSSSRQGDYNVF